MEIIFELLAELLLQIVFEVLAELGVHSVKETFKRPPNPFVAAIGYAIFGALAGGISLFWHPTHFTKTLTARVAVLILVPLAAGAAMALLGAWRRRRDQSLIRLDRFAYGYLFALAMAATRFTWGQ
jgi:multisubunit Na+/H+ antiporter MnhG subunit